MTTSPETVLVRFDGEGSGIGPLSWGQRHSWDVVTRSGVPLCVGGVQEAPPGRTVEEMAAVLRFVMGRHQALRTRLVPGPDGGPVQQVHASGEIGLELVDAAGSDPAEVAAGLYERYAATAFDYARQWPVRMGVVRQGLELTHVVVAYAHVALDGAGLQALVRDILANLGTAGPVTGWPPLEQARWQGSAAGERQNEQALRVWAKALRELPARQFAPSADPRRPRYWEVSFDSPAMFRAIGAVAARNGVGTSPVLLAAFAIALGRITLAQRVAFQVMVGNRFRPGFGDSVSPTSQASLCVLDIAGATFDEVVGQVESLSMRMHLCAYYDPARLGELIDSVGRERGQQVDLSCLFNDRRFESPRQVEPADLAGPDEIRAALPLSRLRWSVQMQRWNEKLFVHVNDVPGVLQLFACGDTDFVSPAQLEACLRAMEESVVAAACELTEVVR